MHNTTNTTATRTTDLKTGDVLGADTVLAVTAHTDPNFVKVHVINPAHNRTDVLALHKSALVHVG